MTATRFERKEVQIAGQTVGFVKVPGGVFFMGSDFTRTDRWPMVKVRVDGFMMSEHVVTQDLFESVMGFNRSHFKGKRLPVTNVSHVEASAFCKQVSETMQGYILRLPTEAEWERAASGGQRFRYAGSDDPGDVAWHLGNSDAELRPVGLKKPNYAGLYDMSGNVWEWCSDVYRNKYADRPWPLTPLIHNPRCKKKESSNRVVRGGCFLVEPRICGVKERSRRPQTGICSYVGFRMVMEF